MTDVTTGPKGESTRRSQAMPRTPGDSSPHLVSAFHRVLLRSRPLFVAVLICTLLLSAYTVKFHFVALSTDAVYEKDFKQEYVLARAVLDRWNPYLPQAALYERYLPAALEVPLHPGPVPHPPFAAIIALPFGLLPYPAAAAAWLGFEILLLVCLTWLAAASVGGRLSRRDAALALALLSIWNPVSEELAWGQLSLLIAVLLAATFIARERGHPSWAGIALGLAIAVKVFPAIAGVYFFARKDYRTLAWSAGTLLASSAVSLLVVGHEGIKSFLTAGLQGATYWTGGLSNYSLPGVVARAFAGGMLVFSSTPFSIPPLYPAPQIVGILQLVVGLAIVIFVWRLVRATGDRLAAYYLTLSAALLMSPVTWPHYLVILVGPLWLAVVRLRAQNWPISSTNLLLASLICTAVPPWIVALTGLLIGVWWDAGVQLTLLALPAGIAGIFTLLAKECLATPANAAQSAVNETH